MTPELRWLSDPTVFAVNRLDAHSDHLCCRTLDEAERGLTSLRQSLDGARRFAWSAHPAARPAPGPPPPPSPPPPPPRAPPPPPPPPPAPARPPPGRRPRR